MSGQAGGESPSTSVVGTAKWLASASGALAAALAAGLQFTGLGEARSPIWSIVAFIGALVACSLVIWFASRVILPAYDSLAALKPLQQQLRKRVASERSKASKARGPLADPTEIDLFAEHDDMFLYLQPSWTRSPAELLHDLRTAAPGTVDAARTAVREMLEACNAYRARERYRHLLFALAGAGALLAVCIPLLAINVAPPTSDTDFKDARSIEIRFADTPDGLVGESCQSTATFEALAIGGSYLNPDVRVAAQNGCGGVNMTLRIDDEYQLVDVREGPTAEGESD